MWPLLIEISPCWMHYTGRISNAVSAREGDLKVPKPERPPSRSHPVGHGTRVTSSMCNTIDFCLYASVLDVKRCADCCDGTVTRFSTCGARLRGYSCFRLPHFGAVLNCQYRSIQVQVSIFQLSTIAALYKKRPRGVQRGAALCPFAVSFFTKK